MTDYAKAKERLREELRGPQRRRWLIEHARNLIAAIDKLDAALAALAERWEREGSESYDPGMGGFHEGYCGGRNDSARELRALLKRSGT